MACPVGGGGLIAGTALAAKYHAKDCEIIGGEPFEADDAYRSLLSGKIETNASTNTIADGLRTHLGSHNFPIIKDNVKQIIRVSEDEIIEAMKLFNEIESEVSGTIVKVLVEDAQPIEYDQPLFLVDPS